LKVLAVETESLAGPGPLENLHRLQGPSETVLARYLEAIELFRPVTHPDSEPQPAVGNDVDGGSILGQPQRMIERCEQHVGPDRYPLRACRDRRERRHDRREVTVVGEMMFRHPDRV